MSNAVMELVLWILVFVVLPTTATTTATAVSITAITATTATTTATTTTATTTAAVATYFFCTVVAILAQGTSQANAPFSKPYIYVYIHMSFFK